MDKLKVDDVMLEKYFFTSTQIAANPAHKPNEKQLTSFNVDVDVGKRENDSEKFFGVSLRVNTDDENSTNIPYRFDVSAVAFMVVTSEDFDFENAKEAVCALGQQILFGAIREHLALQTGHGPWDSVQLRPIAYRNESERNTSGAINLKE